MFVSTQDLFPPLTIFLTVNKTNNKGQSPEQSAHRGAKPAKKSERSYLPSIHYIKELQDLANKY